MQSGNIHSKAANLAEKTDASSPVGLEGVSAPGENKLDWPLLSSIYDAVHELRKGLVPQVQIVEKDLFKEYMHCAPGWIKNSFCLTDYIWKVGTQGLKVYFDSRETWQIEMTKEAFVEVGARAEANYFVRALETFGAGLSLDELESQFQFENLSRLLSGYLAQFKSEALEWVHLVKTTG